MPKATTLKLLLGLLITAFLTIGGLYGMLTPLPLCEQFGLPLTFPASGEVVPHPSLLSHATSYIQIMSGRNVTLGLITLILVARGNWKAVGTITGMLALNGVIEAALLMREGKGLADVMGLPGGGWFVDGWVLMVRNVARQAALVCCPFNQTGSLSIHNTSFSTSFLAITYRILPG